METDKIPANKFLSAVMDTTDTDTDSSALYCSALEEISMSNSQVYNDESTLEASHEITLEKTMEKTVKHAKSPHLLNSPAVKRFANSPLMLSGRKQLLQQNISSTPCIAPVDENDLNAVNKENWSKLTLNFEKNVEIVNQQLENVKLELPQKANWRFTSPSNPAFNFEIDPVPEKEKKISPGQVAFQKTATRVSQEYEMEDLMGVAPPLTGRESMAIDDFAPMKQLFKVKTPCKQLPISETDTESDASPVVTAEFKPIKTLVEQAFEKMAASMANSSIDEIYSKDEEKKPAIKESLLPKRTSISTAYRKGVVSKVNSAPGVTSQVPAAKKRATWASRQPITQLPGIAETKTLPPKAPLPSRKSFLPTKSLDSGTSEAQKSSTGAIKKRQSLHPAALRPASMRKVPPETKTEAPKKPPAMPTLKIATVKVGNRRSSFGKSVGKLSIRKSMLPSRASPKPTRRSVMPLAARRSVMPPPASGASTSTASSSRALGAIPKQASLTKTASKSELMCKYCDKKFMIPKALDDHLLLKCTKIPPKDKKQLLSQSYAARESEYSRKATGNKSIGANKTADPMESSASSAASNGNSAMKSLPRTNRAHSGLIHTPNKQITCMACGAKFGNVVNYTIHMTSEHGKAKKDTETPEKEEN
ncbi:uncharacterized protein LOC134834024 [Culicoides brevitarsis]|uniref:uncharacterized protein LOC134834024 n=1 Tax=Culicoides brevitarsis TaxID=469753 RepID=UPI00307C4CC5